MPNQEIKVKKLGYKRYQFDVPVGKERVEVEFRLPSQRDEVFVQGLEAGDEESLFSRLVVRWGAEDGISAAKLKEPRYDKPFEILKQVFTSLAKPVAIAFREDEKSSIEKLIVQYRVTSDDRIRLIAVPLLDGSSISFSVKEATRRHESIRDRDIRNKTHPAERYAALLIENWREDGGTTTYTELLDPKYDFLLDTVGKVQQEFFRTEYSVTLM